MDYSQILKKHLFLHLLRKEAMRQNAVGLMGCQMPILTYIDRKPGCTQADLARKMFVSPASIAKSIDRLENSGLVTREVSQDSKRQYTLFLTENAKKAVKIPVIVFSLFLIANPWNMVLSGFAPAYVNNAFVQFVGSLFALILIFLYNGQRGSLRISKYFFYAYYPAHLLLFGLAANYIV